jgi:5-methyltetrahydrofolate--homocysteine methyltransferase
MKKIGGLGLLEYVKEHILILDGATGTYLQSSGMGPGVCPEAYVLEHKDIARGMYRAYIEAGSNAVFACTFGANAVKLKEFGLEHEAIRMNRELTVLAADAAGENAFVGADIGSTGLFLAPLGDLEFEKAVDIYKQQITALEQGGADFIVIETMIDVQEARAAVIAAKECCSLPVAVSMTFDSSGRTLTGTSPAAAAITLISAGADIVGLNCSTGPEEMIPFVKSMKSVSSVPLFVKPNAGMPHMSGGRTHFDLSCADFRAFVRPLCEAGANLIGGCCGTGPDYIRAIKEEIKGLMPLPWLDALPPAVTSVSDEVYFGSEFRVIGERINPTGKPKLKEALRNGDVYEMLDMAIEQKNSGAHILDINVGMPEIDENAAMERAIEAVGARVKLPLSIDSSKPDVIERALRVYSGRALVNSVSTKAESLARLLPVVKKYNAMFILLPIGDGGIPQTAQGRIEEIEKAYEVITRAGLGRESMLIDGLTMAVSSDPGAAKATHDVVAWCTEHGFNTVLGVSNSSFGLPERKFINSAYLVMAMKNGLTSAIMNPNDTLMMDMCHAAEALTGGDADFKRYIKRFSDTRVPEQDAKDIAEAVLTGKKKPITAMIDAEIAKGVKPEQIINGMIIPALQQVGDLYERKVYFLPHLIYSAEAARAAFDHHEKHYITDTQEGKKKVVIATVKGDIHDIGKNLVAMLLRNHGFAVTDLGKDVPAETIIETAAGQDADIVGLSALITTTAKEMENVIELARQKNLRAKIMVGGAVITEKYAQSIGADAYAADAAGAVREAARLTQ